MFHMEHQKLIQYRKTIITDIYRLTAASTADELSYTHGQSPDYLILFLGSAFSNINLGRIKPHKDCHKAVIASPFHFTFLIDNMSNATIFLTFNGVCRYNYTLILWTERLLLQKIVYNISNVPHRTLRLFLKFEILNLKIAF